MTEHDILTVEEVARMLRISETTLSEMVNKGEIPAGKLGDSWRFKRTEVKKWIDARLGGGVKRHTPHHVALSDILAPERTRVLTCVSKEEALCSLIELLAQTPEVLDRDELEKELFHREDLMSTGIGLGVAVPHVRLESVRDIVMAMGVNQFDITDYPSLDGKPVRIICMIAAAENQHVKYIKVLAEISSILKNDAVRTALIHAPDAPSVYEIMVREGT